MPKLFSFRQRALDIQQLSAYPFDLLIIGGGITGAGIALDAASRGMKTALIEKNDFAYGTSSRSTKLIHGGLRYLKQLEFGLVKEVGSERAMVHRLAPHIVISEKMLLPLREGRGFGTLLTSLGLKLYDWLAGVSQTDQRKMLTRQQTLRQEPLLKPEGVKGGGLYAEYRTDDARLTLEIIKTARRFNACVASYTEAVEFIYNAGNIAGVRVKDHITNANFDVRAAVVVNAAGPWVDLLRQKDNSRKGKTLRLTKGVHIVVPRERLPVRQAVYFDVPDGRLIFAIPRGRTTYIGTTDTDYAADPDTVTTTKEDALYLIAAVNDSFNTANLSLNDIESSWAGLRPLIHEEGKPASGLSRKDEIFESPAGLISIAGGKLTGYRKMAERIVDMAAERLNRENFSGCITHTISLGENNFSNAGEVNLFKQKIHSSLLPYGLQSFTDYLIENFGKQTERVISYTINFNDDDPSVRLARAELQFALEHEMVLSGLDFFVRRTGMLLFDMPRLLKVYEVALADMAIWLNWNEAQQQHEKHKLMNAIAEARIQ